MDFQLDDMAGLAGAYTIAWKITDDDGSDTWSSRFAAFKRKEESPTNGALFLLKGALSGLIAYLKIDVSKTVIIPALSSKETVADENGQLGYLAKRCAEHIGAGFRYDAVTKKVHPSIHGLGALDNRRAALKDADYQATAIKGAKTILILDDFMTAGSTLSHTAQAIHTTTPNATVYGLALGKAERRSWKSDISNDHVPTKWDTLWKQGEQKYQEHLRSKKA